MCFWFPGALGPVIGKHVAGLMSGASNGWGELGLILHGSTWKKISKASNAALSWFTERATMDDRSLDLPWTCHGLVLVLVDVDLGFFVASQKPMLRRLELDHVDLNPSQKNKLTGA